MAENYALIVGQGRSGTNWLLRSFDYSATTFCRNEPNECAGSALATLDPWRVWWREDVDQIGEAWDEAVAAAVSQMGERDHRVEAPKQFLREPAQMLDMQRWLRGPRMRPLLSRVMPRLRDGEWPPPGWLADAAAFERSFGILKLTTCPGWAWFVLRNRPDVPVFHIVRHPGGFLNSWSSRYLGPRDEERVLTENRARIAELHRWDPERAARLGAGEDADLDRSELAYWRYANELILEAGKGSPAYHYIPYEDFVADPVATMRPLYAAAGLDWTDDVQQRVAAESKGSHAIAKAWRSRLDEAQIELVERTVEETTLPLSDAV